MKRLLLILCFLLLCAFSASADRVRVRLFSTNTVATLNVSFDLGQYNLYANGDQLLEDMVGEGRSVLVRADGGRLHVQQASAGPVTFSRTIKRRRAQA